jgi:hypothetical protein
MDTATTRDTIPGQVEVQIPDGREFAVIRGRRWTRVFEYLSNGQLTARWFFDEKTGETREAEGARKPRNWRLGNGASEFVGAIIESANELRNVKPDSERRLTASPDVASRRDWLNVGKRYSEPYRDAIERQIEALIWTDAPQAAMVPGLGIRECVKQLELPNVTVYATNGYLEVPDGEETAAYSIYGIEAGYTNAKIRLYVLDRGSEILPLCVDVWPKAPA